MPEAPYELLWQRVVAALKKRHSDVPSDAPPDIAASLPDSPVSREVRRFLTQYYYPARYGATNEALTRDEAEQLVARIQRACEPAPAAAEAGAAPGGRWDDARTVVKYLVGIFAVIGTGVAFGIDLKTDRDLNPWGGVLLLIGIGLYVAANPSWRQIWLAIAALLLMYAVPIYWDHAFGEIPVLWGTHKSPGLAPKVLSVGIALIWFGGGLLPVLRRGGPGAARVDWSASVAGRSGARPVSAAARALFLIVGVLCLAGAAATLAESATKTVRPQTTVMPGIKGPISTIPPRVQTHWVTRYQRENGINFASGLVLVVAGLLALNRASKRLPEDEGLLDRLLGHRQQRSVLPLLPALLAMAALGWFGYLLTMRTEIHWNAETAASAFAAARLSNDLYVTGNIMYGVTHDEATTHVASFTPSLVRAIDRMDIGVGAFARDFEYPMPGLLPIAFMFALCAARGVQTLRRSTARRRSDAAPWLLASGVLNLYVLAWLVSAQRGVLLDGGVHSGWVVDLFLILLPLSATVLAVIHRKLESHAVSAAARSGWISLQQASVLAPVAWSFWLSDAAVGSPVLLWILLYLASGCLMWWLLLLDDAEEGVA